MRLKRLKASLGRRGVDGFLVTNITNVRYLTGFRGSSCFVLLTEKRNIFVTDFRYREEAEKELKAGSVGGIVWDIVIEKGNRLKTIKGLVRDLNIRCLGFESSISYELFAGLSRVGIRLKPLKGTVEGMRVLKDPEEVALIREAVRRAEAAFLDVKPFIRQGRGEREIALMLEERLKKRGCNRLPFDIIVAAGANSSMPHAQAGNKRLSPGDLVIIDWGGEAGGYYSDMTRTFLIKGGIKGDVSLKREIYETVLKANREASVSVMPDINSREIDKRARDVIKDRGYDKFFGHGTGHGIGLEVHESPSITWKKGETIRENMVFTVEPGIYIPGVGGVRIEDMVLVKHGRAEVLTKLPRRLEII